MFDEMVQQGPSNVVKGCTCVSTVAVALFGGRFNLDEGDENGISFFLIIVINV